MRLKGAVEARRVRDRSLCRSDIFSVNINRTTLLRFPVTSRYSTSPGYSLQHSCSLGPVSLFNSLVKVGFVESSFWIFTSEGNKMRNNSQSHRSKGQWRREFRRHREEDKTRERKRTADERKRIKEWRKTTIPDFWRNRTITFSRRPFLSSCC